MYAIGKVGIFTEKGRMCSGLLRTSSDLVSDALIPYYQTLVCQRKVRTETVVVAAAAADSEQRQQQQRQRRPYTVEENTGIGPWVVVRKEPEAAHSSRGLVPAVVVAVVFVELTAVQKPAAVVYFLKIIQVHLVSMAAAALACYKIPEH